MFERSSKAITEDIEAAELERAAHVLEAKQIYETAKSNRREITVAEQGKFDLAVAASEAAKDRIDDLRRQLSEAKHKEQNILARGKMQTTTNGHGYHVANQTFNEYFGPDKVLPVNGQLPGQRYSGHRYGGRLRAFNSVEEAYDSGIWLKAFVARAVHGVVDEAAEKHLDKVGLSIQAAMSEGSGSSGGYLTPAPLSAAIISVRDRVGVARQIASLMPMTSDTLSIPKRNGGLVVYSPGENSEITASDATLKQIELICKKRAVLTLLSQELNNDSIVPIVDYLTTEMGFALAQQEDRETVNGDGSATTYFGVRGLLSSIGSAGVFTASTGDHDEWSELTLSDLTSTVALLPEKFHEYSPAWLCSHGFYHAVMVRLALSAGGATLSETVNGVGGVPTFLGYPVFRSSQMPIATATSSKCALFGAFSQAVLFGDNGGIRMARSDDYRFANDQIALKATSRYDVKVHEPGDASNAGAYVALSTNS